MPPVVAGIAKYVVAKGTIFKFIAQIAIQIAVSKLFAPKIPKGAGLRPASVMKRSGLEYRNLVYGRAMVSGPVVYNNIQGPTGQWLWYVVALAEGVNEDIEEVWFDAYKIAKADIDWTVGTGGADGTGTGAVSTAIWVGADSTTAVNLFLYPGHADQVTCGALDTAFGQIDSTHRGRNLAYVVAKLAYLPDTETVWKDGPPTDIKALVKGRKVYDPRLDSTTIIDPTTSPVTYGSGAHRLATSSTWAWSENPALCITDYLTQIMGVAAGSIDWPSIANTADDCEVAVVIPPAASPENTEDRFTCNGSISLGATHKDNLDALVSSCDGRLSYSAGKWKLRASVWEASSVSITEDDLSGEVSVRGSAPKSERFNVIRGFLIDKQRKYQPAEFAHATSSAYLTRDNGEEISYDMELPCTNSEPMAQRIAYRNLHQGNNQIACTLHMNARGMKIAIGDVVDLTIDYLSWSAKTFRCVGWERNQDGTFKVTLREDNAASYTDPVVGDYGTYDAGEVTVPSDAVPAPTNLSATVAASGVLLGWDNPAAAEHDFIDIYESTGSVFDTSPELVRIARVRSDSYLVPHDEDGTTYYYWLKAVRLPELMSERFPDNSTSPEATVSATMGAGGAGVGNITPFGCNLLDAATDPDDAEVAFKIDNDGDVYTQTGFGASFVSVGTWLNTGVVGDYEVMLEDYGTGTSTPTGAALDTWLDPSTDRTITLTDTSPVGGTLTFYGRARWRDATTFQDLGSADIDFSVDVSV